jgi:acetate kinase
MGRTLVVLNAGSSSVKFAVARNRRIIARGGIEHFGRTAGVRIQSNGRTKRCVMTVPNLQAALHEIQRIVAGLDIVPDAVAHRIVHGGPRFSKPTRLTPAVISSLKKLIPLAPLHEPAHLTGIAFARRAWPKATQWGVFDTAIYRVLPEHVRTYALPRRITRPLGIEKFGFHGTSHAWAFRTAVKKLGVSQSKLSAVTIHLGAGASMTLWQNGKPADTTMGFTPLEGLVMLTRSGDIDPAIPLYLQEHLGWPASRVNDLLQNHSGLVGLSGFKDMRDILAAVGKPVAGWPRPRLSAAVRKNSRLALDVFIYRIRLYLAAYLGLTKNPKVIVFTGPMAENRTIQRMILDELPAARGIKTLSVHADEEQAIVDVIRP